MTAVTSLRNRGQAVAAVARRDGARRLMARSLRTAADRVAGGEPPPLAVRADHLIAPAADLDREWRPNRSGPLVINWITNPPNEGSGGMSTLMQSIALLEGRGHQCRIAVLFKGLRRDLTDARRTAHERFPEVRATVDDLDDGLRPADAVVATAWPTAYALRATARTGVPFYLVQDHEPSFYPASSDAVLAEETYRFGFHGMTAGRWLAGKLDRDHGMCCTAFDLGVDLATYRLAEDASGSGRRNGVVFYARPDTPRRGFELGMAALALIARRRPDVPIHLVGQRLSLRHPGFAFTNHGHCSPAELAAIYSACTAGLVLSLTNLSLLPAELLATGCIPVMNDGENTRASFTNRHARFARPDPEALAAAVEAVLEDPGTPAARAEAAASVGSLAWEHVADRLELALGRGIDRWLADHP